MPIYEYRCDKGHTFEALQRMNDDPLIACEVCEAPVQRVFHPVAVHFKGSGFYATDYGKKKAAAAAGEARRNGSEGSSGSGGSESGSSDSGASDSSSSDSATSKSSSSGSAGSKPAKASKPD